MKCTGLIFEPSQVSSQLISFFFSSFFDFRFSVDFLFTSNSFKFKSEICLWLYVKAFERIQSSVLVAFVFVLRYLVKRLA